MEDAHSCVSNIQGLPECAFFGVFDGHGGAGAAHYLSEALLPNIIEHVSKYNDESQELHKTLETAVPHAFVATDDFMSEHTKDYTKPGDTEDPGSTAITSIITPSHLVFAHLGDARFIISSTSV